MRVAVVSPYTTFHCETRATRRTQRIAEHLVRADHDVTWLCAQWWGGDIGEFEHDGVTYRAVSEEPATRSFSAKLPLALRSADPEVIHAVNHPPGPVRAARATGRVLRTPVVVDWWDDRPDVSETAYRKAVSAASRVTTPSRTVQTRVREHGASESEVSVIPESIDMSLVRRAAVDDRADIVYARDLDEDANIETFLLALAELRTRDWRATVIGDGPLREDAEEMAEDLRIDDRVEFLGDLPDEDRIPILKGAHVFAQTARREPFAIDLLWALACGCVGVVEYQADSSAHELVEGRDRHCLVTSPQELADEIVAAAGLERKTIDEAFAEYDHNRVREQWLSCYREVIDDFGLF